MEHWTQSQIAGFVEKEVLKYWIRANIAPQTYWWIRRKILVLVKTYEKLVKKCCYQYNLFVGCFSSNSAKLVRAVLILCLVPHEEPFLLDQLTPSQLGQPLHPLSFFISQSVPPLGFHLSPLATLVHIVW